MASTLLKIKVIPKASKTTIVGWKGDELHIRVAAAPEKGKANVEINRFLSEALDIAKSNIILIKGEKSRHKQFKIFGKTLDEIKIAGQSASR